MQSKRLLILKLLLVTVAAVVVGHYAVANLRTIKIAITDFGVSFVSYDYRNPNYYNPPTMITNNVDFINKNYPYHLVSPSWMNSRDELLIWNWFDAEKETRLGLISTLWLAVSIFIIRRHFRNQRKP